MGLTSKEIAVDCPTCGHEWSRHSKALGRCTVRSTDASGNYDDDCGCTEQPKEVAPAINYVSQTAYPECTESCSVCGAITILRAVQEAVWDTGTAPQWWLR